MMCYNVILKEKRRLFFWLIFAVCVFVRFFKLGAVPLGLNQDEAFSAFETLNLLETGTDSWGYRYPMYFISWGSGMNALYAYLLSVFFLIFGTDDWVVRLPQAIFGVLSCYVFYRLVSFVYGKRAGLLGFFLVSIAPWHLMLSRWGLESNIAPAFMLLGCYFFLRGVKKEKYLPLSALFYGGALYGYATCWVFIGVVFVLNNGYLLWHKIKLNNIGWGIVAEVLVFGLCALPICLFLAVNFGVIEEIKTAYFSVPKMVYWRGGEVGFNDFFIKLEALGRILIYGNDFLTTNAVKPYGLFYPLSLVFIVIGLYFMAKKAKEDVGLRKFSFNLLFLAHIVYGFVYALMLYPCINRLNFLWFYLLIAVVLGISVFERKVVAFIVAGYIVFSFLFLHTYFTAYHKLAEEWFSPGFKEALEVANQNQARLGNTIYIEEKPFSYSKVLFYGKVPARDFQRTVVWKRFPDAYLDVLAFLHYKFEEKPDYHNVSANDIYIVPKERAYYFWNFEVYRFGGVAVAIPKDGQ